MFRGIRETPDYQVQKVTRDLKASQDCLAHEDLKGTREIVGQEVQEERMVSTAKMVFLEQEESAGNVVQL